MRVICPHAGPIAPEVMDALNAAGYRWDAVDVSSADTAYTRLLEQLWTVGETFALVEHDIVIPPSALAELDECPADWCAFEYPFRAAMHAGLGCTKFSALLIRDAPDAVADTWDEETEAHPRGHWCNLDDRLRRTLVTTGARQHIHHPPVHHLNPEPSHGCS